MHTVITTNNSYDSILLVNDENEVVSRWDATAELVREYVERGANAGEWNVDEWPAGFAPSEQASEAEEAELRTVAAYGIEYGRDGAIESAERREFWHLS